jgi:hypothetical protein
MAVVPEGRDTEEPDARQLKERMDRLDETWLGSWPCSCCFEDGTIAGETTAIRNPMTPRALRIHSGIGAIAQSVRAADSSSGGRCSAVFRDVP